MNTEIKHGDCLEVMRGMEANSIDAIITDPPYGLQFMEKDWDHGIPGCHFWEEAIRVAKPGAHLLAFGGTRTFHRLVCAIEDAGWEIRDCVMWIYGSGFPKSLDVSKAIDKAAGINTAADERWREADEGHCKRGPRRKRDPVINQLAYHSNDHNPNGVRHLYVPDSDIAQQWSGWGTALKPAYEPIILARKPLEGTVAENVLQHGCGGLNVDGCRIPMNGDNSNFRKDKSGGCKFFMDGDSRGQTEWSGQLGRWPANVIHDGSEEVVGLFPQVGKSSGGLTPGVGNKNTARCWAFGDRLSATAGGYGDSGTAARFFYCAKASKAERDEGLEGFDNWDGGRITGRKPGTAGLEMADGKQNPYAGKASPINRNHHPTVKPIALMRYLCRLITPPGGLVLDPFCGSGSTGIAAALEGCRFVGIEQDAEYCRIAEARIDSATRQGSLFELLSVAS